MVQCQWNGKNREPILNACPNIATELVIVTPSVSRTLLHRGEVAAASWPLCADHFASFPLRPDPAKGVLHDVGWTQRP